MPSPDTEPKIPVSTEPVSRYSITLPVGNKSFHKLQLKDRRDAIRVYLIPHGFLDSAVVEARVVQKVAELLLGHCVMAADISLRFVVMFDDF